MTVSTISDDDSYMFVGTALRCQVENHYMDGEKLSCYGRGLIRHGRRRDGEKSWPGFQDLWKPRQCCIIHPNSLVVNLKRM